MFCALRNLGRLRLQAALAGVALGVGGIAACSPASAAAARPSFELCPEVACKSSEELAAMFGEQPSLRRVRHAGASASTVADNSQQATPSSSHPSTPEQLGPYRPYGCPPVREELGRSTWTLLHAAAAYYPEKPTTDDVEAARGLVTGLARLYPCTHCRAAFQADIADHPPTLESRESFSLWVCAQHNRVNSYLGKPTFPCSLADLDERWRTGRRECWVPAGSAASVEGVTAEESLGQAAEASES